jgi:hypothetical protein
MAHQPDLAELTRTLGINLFLDLDEQALIQLVISGGKYNHR